MDEEELMNMFAEFLCEEIAPRANDLKTACRREQDPPDPEQSGDRGWGFASNSFWRNGRRCPEAVDTPETRVTLKRQLQDAWDRLVTCGIRRHGSAT